MPKWEHNRAILPIPFKNTLCTPPELVVSLYTVYNALLQITQIFI